jgi:hypothetical protein
MMKFIPLAAVLVLAAPGLALAQSGGVSHRETMKVPEQRPDQTSGDQAPATSGTSIPAPSTAAPTTADPGANTGIAPPSVASPTTNRDLEQEPGAMTRRPGRGGR